MSLTIKAKVRYLCVLASLVLLMTSCEKQRTPQRHLIPSTYEGVVITIFNQQGFPELPIRDGYLVFEYPEDGIIITSSKLEYGWASDQIQDVLPDGSHQKIASGQSQDRREHFAVSGFEQVGGQLEFEYAFKVIGSQQYFKGIDATAYDAKIEEAKQKLKSYKLAQKE